MDKSCRMRTPKNFQYHISESEVVGHPKPQPHQSTIERFLPRESYLHISFPGHLAKSLKVQHILTKASANSGDKTEEISESDGKRLLSMRSKSNNQLMAPF